METVLDPSFGSGGLNLKFRSARRLPKMYGCEV